MRYVILLILTLIVWTAATAASSQLESYRLNYRSADELIRLIQPHLSDDAHLSGIDNSLLLSGTEADHQRLQQLLSELDRPPINLMVSLRTGQRETQSRSGGGVSGRAGRDGIEGEVRIYRSENARADDRTRSVRVLNGRAAKFTSTLHLPVRHETAWQSRKGGGYSQDTRFLVLEAGFYVTPRLQGETVNLDIRAATQDGLQQREVLTQVNGRLGEWIPLAVSEGIQDDRDSGLTIRSRSARAQGHQAWIKVDQLD